MPGWLKALLIVLAVIVLLVVGVVGAGVWWWMKNKDAFIGRAKEVISEGRDFGRNSDNQGCVDESISRYKKDPGFTSGISTGIFMRACLDASRPTPNFCADVPKPTEFLKTPQWRADQCRKVDLEKDSYCQQLFQQVQEYCAKKSFMPSEDSNSNSQ